MKKALLLSASISLLALAAHAQTITNPGGISTVTGDCNGAGAGTVSITCTQAAQWTTPRNLSLTGDITGTLANVNGASAVSGATTLATVNAAPGTYGSATQVPVFSVNAKGLTTFVTNTSITAPTLQTPHTISITGDLSYTSSAFDGSTDVSGAGTLATVNASPGTYGDASHVPTIVVNGKGLVTSITTNTVSAIAGGSNTQVQYNSTGALAGSAGFTTDGSSITLTGGINIANTQAYTFTSRSKLTSPVDGNIRLSNNAATGFGLLQFGGTTSTFPAIKKDSTSGVLDIRLADDSAYGSLFLQETRLNSLVDLTTARVIYSRNGTIAQLFNDGTWTAVTLIPSLLQIGGTSASFPAIQRSGTHIQTVLADSSNYAGLDAEQIISRSSNIGGISPGLQVYNTATDTAGNEAGVLMLPSGNSACNSKITGYRDGTTTASGVKLYSCIGSTTYQTFSVDSSGHPYFVGNSGPALSGCGTGPTYVGNDNRGVVTNAADTGTSCTVTFAKSWDREPICIITLYSNGATTVGSLSAAPTVSSFTVKFSAAYNSGIWAYHCEG